MPTPIQSPDSPAKIEIHVHFLTQDVSQITVFDRTTAIETEHEILHSRESGQFTFACDNENHDPEQHGGPEINWLTNLVQNIFPDWDID